MKNPIRSVREYFAPTLKRKKNMKKKPVKLTANQPNIGMGAANIRKNKAAKQAVLDKMSN